VTGEAPDRGTAILAVGRLVSAWLSHRQDARATQGNRLQRLSVAVGALSGSDGEGVVATFFLIRYQSIVASRREINFARQFFRISLFIIAVQ
jgi:hypothetical protein